MNDASPCHEERWEPENWYRAPSVRGWKSPKTTCLHCQLRVLHLPELYRPLDATKRQIRLLKILPWTDQELRHYQIECSLCTVDLTPAVNFDALSYAWGDRDYDMRIYVNGHPMTVTENLYNALEALRHNKVVDGFIWIDAICINQEDSVERSQQVLLMREIYSQASNVRVWFGRESETTVPVLESLEDIRDGASAVQLLAENPAFVDGLMELLDNPWWYRVWIVQEVLLARRQSVTMHVGDQPVLLFPLIDCLYTMASRDLEQAPQTILAHAAVTGSLSRVVNLFRTIGPVVDGASAYRFLTEANCTGRVSNDKDRVYGLLGILPSSIAILPDYSKSVEDVYETSAVQIMQWSGSLDLLMLVNTRRRDASLPSWVPDWRDIDDDSLLVYGSRTRSSSAGALCSIYQDTEGELVVRAMTVASHFHRGDLVAPSLKNSTTREQWTRRLRSVVLGWWKLALGCCDPSEESDRFKFRFWRTLSQGRLGYADSYKLGPEEELSFASQMAQWLDDNGPHTENPGLEALLMMSAGQAQGRNFCATRCGLMCLSSRRSRMGDRLVIIAGCRKPLLLRPRADRAPGVYEVVTSCYVEGIMEGEAVRQAARDRFGVESAVDGLFEQITLV